MTVFMVFSLAERLEHRLYCNARTCNDGVTIADL